MKVQQTNQKQFIPVQITLETQEEVNAIYALLNHAYLSEAVGMTGQWELLRDYRTEEYRKLHDKLQRLLGVI